MATVSKFLDHQRELLRLERETEVAAAASLNESASLRELVRAGLAVTRLQVGDVHIALGGRWVVRLLGGGGRIVYTGLIKVGDSVIIAGDGVEAFEGVVRKVGEWGLEVMLNDWKENKENGKLFVAKVGSNVTFKRCITALDRLEKVVEDIDHPSHFVAKVVFGQAEPRFTKPLHCLPTQLSCLERLNEDQREAVEHALAARDLAVIHGPPGTGKTTTIIALICAAVAGGAKVLFAAPSNVAVDTVGERLMGKGVKFTRLGHPARLMPALVRYSLESMLESTEEWGIVKDIRKEMEELRTTKRRENWKEYKELRTDARRREDRALKQLIGGLDVILATVAGSGSQLLRDACLEKAFDLVVIDEAAQALEASSWIPLLLGRKAVLVGDPFQLPPTVKSSEAEGKGLGKSILDRVFETSSLREACVKMLTVQYRMHQIINDWSSEAMYNGRLTAAPEVAQWTLAGLDSAHPVKTDDNTQAVFVLIDTAGCDCEEDVVEDFSSIHFRASDNVESKSNQMEATIVAGHVKLLLEAGVPNSCVAVISPYSRQVSILRDVLRDQYSHGLEIATVDSFQGREKDAVIISLVRSNDHAEVGFLRDSRRLNVAITRAKRHVALICDSDTVTRDPFLAHLIKYMEVYGEYRSAIEYGIAANFGSRPPPEALTNNNARSAKAKSPFIGTEKSKGKKRRPKPPAKANAHEADLCFGSEKDKRRVEEIELELASMAENPEFVEKKYPASLSSWERQLIHRYSEKLGLQHKSIGSGFNRRIVVARNERSSLRTNNPEEKVVHHKTKSQDEPDNISEFTDQALSVAKSSDTVVSQDQSATLSRDMIDQSYYPSRPAEKTTTDVKGAPSARSAASEGEAVAVHSRTLKRRKKKTKKQKSKQPRDEIESFDELLARYGPPDENYRTKEEPSASSSSRVQIVNGVVIRGCSRGSGVSSARRAVLAKQLEKKLALAAKVRAKKSQSKP